VGQSDAVQDLPARSSFTDSTQPNARSSRYLRPLWDRDGHIVVGSRELEAQHGGR
jgi:hypothetical protein